MNAAAEIIETLEARGFILVPIEGGKLNVKPMGQVTAEVRDLILDHKPAILRELRRRQALQMLAGDQKLQRAFIVDPDSDPDSVLVMLVLRGVGSCDLEIPRDRWDPFLFIKFLEGREQ